MSRLLSVILIGTASLIAALPITVHAQAEGTEITGTVTSVTPRDRRLKVRGDVSQQEYTYTVPEDTRITMAGKETRLRNIRRGDKITLRFRPTDTDRRVATRLRVPEPVVPLAQRIAEAPTQETRPMVLPTTSLPWLAWPLAGALALVCAFVLRRVRQR